MSVILSTVLFLVLPCFKCKKNQWMLKKGLNYNRMPLINQMIRGHRGRKVGTVSHKDELAKADSFQIKVVSSCTLNHLMKQLAMGTILSTGMLTSNKNFCIPHGIHSLPKQVPECKHRHSYLALWQGPRLSKRQFLISVVTFCFLFHQE